MYIDKLVKQIGEVAVASGLGDRDVDYEKDVSADVPLTVASIVSLIPVVQKSSVPGNGSGVASTRAPNHATALATVKTQVSQVIASDVYREGIAEKLKAKPRDWGTPGAKGLTDTTTHAAHTVDDCETCRTAGQVTCGTCSGRGDHSCNNCSARGQVPCGQCNRRGILYCIRCGGSGQEWDHYHNRNVRCGVCSGTGLGHRCPSCVGHGWLDCGYCDTTGRVGCNPCTSSGKVRCDPCAGHGKFVTSFKGTIQARPDIKVATLKSDWADEAIKTFVGYWPHFAADKGFTPQFETAEEQPDGTIKALYKATLPFAALTLVDAETKNTYRLAACGSDLQWVNTPLFLDDFLQPLLTRLQVVKEGDVVETVSNLRTYHLGNEVVDMAITEDPLDLKIYRGSISEGFANSMATHVKAFLTTTIRKPTREFWMSFVFWTALATVAANVAYLYFNPDTPLSGWAVRRSTYGLESILIGSVLTAAIIVIPMSLAARWWYRRLSKKWLSAVSAGTAKKGAEPGTPALIATITAGVLSALITGGVALLPSTIRLLINVTLG